MAYCHSDRQPLVALYFATDGPNWTNNTNWLSNAPLGEWHGVTTDDSARVVKLVLSDNNLSGRLPRGLETSPTWRSWPSPAMG